MDMLVIAKSVKVKVRLTNLGIYMSIYLLTSVNLLQLHYITGLHVSNFQWPMKSSHFSNLVYH